MSKKAERPLSPHHILLFDEDWDFLETAYGKYSNNRTGAGVVVRQLVHRAVVLLKQQATEAADRRASSQVLSDPTAPTSAIIAAYGEKP